MRLLAAYMFLARVLLEVHLLILSPERFATGSELVASVHYAWDFEIERSIIEGNELTEK